MSDGLSKRIVRGSSIIFVMTLLSSVVSYAGRAFYANTLSIEEYGLLFAGLGFIGMIWTYVDLGFGYSITYLMPKFVKNNEYIKAWNVFKHGQVIEMLVSMFLAVVIYFSSSLIAEHFFKIPGTEVFVKLLAIYLVLFTFLSSLIQLFTGLQRETYYSSITLFRALFALIISVIFWFAGLRRVSYYVLAFILSFAVVAVIFSWLSKRNFKYLSKNSVSWDRNLVKEMSIYAFPVFLATIVISLQLSSDVFFLTLIRGVVDVGIYNVVVPIASIALILVTPLNGFLMPLISHLAEGEKKKISFLLYKIMEIFPFIGLYFSLFLIIFPKSPIRLFFGNKWLGTSEHLLIYLSLSNILLIMSNVLGTVLLGMGKAKKKLRNNIIVAIINIFMSPFMIIKYGLMGVAITNMFSGVLAFALNLKLVRASVPTKIPYLLYLKFIAFSFVVFFVFRSFIGDDLSLINYLVAGGIYSLIYLIFGILLGILDKQQVKLVLKN